MTNSLTELFLRDLNRLRNELAQYQNHEILWQTHHGISNSGGHLALHLIGNLNHWVGALLAKTGYIRDKINEFEGKPVPVSYLLQEIDSLKRLVQKELNKLSIEDLQGPFPGPIPYELNFEGFLLHLYAHFSYHLGQINYHRRILDK